MAGSINDYTNARWDIADMVVQIDGIKPVLFTSGDIFTLSFAEDNITISSDAYGHGITVINHNGQADLTINISRLDPIWTKILKEKEFKEQSHEIIIYTPVEIISTTSASLAKIPDLNGNKEAPTVPLLYHCVSASVDPNEQ
ncbi:hypothetical protein LOSG293_110240 [Secundilactobacillus oryzae JCM 18671]|uniref:Uncharacterized protein n=1 Tax=Secundilactobacillus oryzae JCM 18671 TaxID=1291743 RepID=A0A081BI40_9LACO|nr:hypothetical protein [Secundilactobacillus oryzae]GAK47708.1 hypothetical protein LOSG293_110240 [Secundilactobacillus oryzae JCM 18671]